MVKTNCKFLENELFDEARLFKSRPENVVHIYHYEDDIFYNEFEIDGEKFFFKDKGIVTDEIIFKRLEKRFAKLRFYEILSNKYGEEMPWGALTGIRPTKLAYTELELGHDPEKILYEMHVSKKNIELVKAVLKTQEGIYEKKDGNTDFFISIPFCPTKCEYCSFITAPIERTREYLQDYIKSLGKEIFAAKELIGNLRSIYIGGGTPLVLSEIELKEVLDFVSQIRIKDCEYTVEAGRPDVFTKEKLQLLQDYGVTRICINPQSFLDKTLVKIGRKHTTADLYRAFEMAKNFNFIVNVDLIAGLADETVEEFTYSVQEAIKTGAENITVHCLCLKSGSRLKEECEYLENPLVSEMVSISRELLTKAGYEPYYLYRQKYQVGNNENIGWTKKGKACVYNIDVMEETADNLAVGANAVSKRVWNDKNIIERCASQKDIRTYLENVDKNIEKRREFFLK